jgi:hypothetical protein
MIKEAYRHQRRPEKQLGSEFTSSIYVNPSNIEITDNVKEAFKQRAAKFRQPVPSDDKIKKEKSEFLSELLTHIKRFIHAPNRPAELGKDADWSVDKVKIDFINNRYVYLFLIENPKQNLKFFIYFDNAHTTRYYIIKTKYFDLNKFPTDLVIKSPQEAEKTAIKITDKQMSEMLGKSGEEMFKHLDTIPEPSEEEIF